MSFHIEFNKLLDRLDGNHLLIISSWSMASSGSSEGNNVIIIDDKNSMNITHILDDCKNVCMKFIYEKDHIEIFEENCKRPRGYEFYIIDKKFPMVFRLKTSANNWDGPY